MTSLMASWWGEESDATELAEARASLRSVATDSEFEQDLRGRRQAELEEERRLLARDRGVQIARRRKRLKNRPAAAVQSTWRARSATSLSCVAEEAAVEEGEHRELERQRKQRAVNAAKAPFTRGRSAVSPSRERAPRSALAAAQEAARGPPRRRQQQRYLN